jgi:membrane protease YdiL (CAAX protease family)
MELTGAAATILPPRRARWGTWATLAWGVGGGLVMIASQTIGAIVYLALSGKMSGGRPLSPESITQDGALIAFTFLISAPLVLGYFALAVRLARATLVDYLALTWPRWWHIALGVVALAVVVFGAGFAAEASGQEIPKFMTETFSTARAAGVLPLFVLSFVFLAPLQEEVLFRGFIYRGLANAWGPALTILLTSAVWAIMHLQYSWFYVGEVFLLGVTFGWLRWLSRSLISTILLHTANNGLAVISMALMSSA